MSGNCILPQADLGRNGFPIQNSSAQKWIAWLTGVLTLTLAIFSFLLSFNALSDLAQRHGVSIPPLFPFVVEFAVIIFSLNALHRSLTGQNARWQWVLIILSSLLAGLFNVAHASNDLLSRAMAAMPSLFLLLSFESFLSQVRHTVIRHSATVTLSKILTQVEDKKEELDRLIGQIQKSEPTLQTLTDDISGVKKRSVTKMQQARQDKVAHRRQKVSQMLEANMSEDGIATELNVSVRTIQRDIAALNGKAEVAK